MSFVVRAVDVGYRNTKFTLGRAQDGTLRTMLIPSLATPADLGADLGTNVVARRNTVLVTADGIRFEVGPDVALAMGLNENPVLHAQYSDTPEHLALLRAAMHYMEVSEIDLLVVGLPVARLAIHKAALTRRLIGVHPAGNGRNVLVKDVRVLPQPIGGFLYHVSCQPDARELQRDTTLIIDPGFLTVDWVVAQGLQPIGKRSGHHDSGVSAVLARMAAAISRDYRLDYKDLRALDHGVRSGQFRLFGEPVALEPYLADASAAVMNIAVNALASSAGDARDIDAIVLVGGGAALFLPAIQRRYPRHTIHVVEDPVFANVRGFHIAGERLVAHQVVA